MRYILKNAQTIIIALAAVSIALSYIQNQTNYFSRSQAPKSIILTTLAEKDLEFPTSTEHFFIINSFASWCLPCHAEHSILLNLSARTSLNIYGFAQNEPKEDTNKFLKDLGNPYHKTFIDSDKTFNSLTNENGTPTTALLNDNLEILWIHKGPLTQTIYEKELLPLLNKLPAGST